MEIKFGYIAPTEYVKKFASENPPETERENFDREDRIQRKADFIMYTYDLQGIEKDLADELNKSLSEAGFKVTPTANNKLWISEPEQFTASLETKLSNNHSPNRRYIPWLGRSDVEQIGTREEKGFFGTKKVLIYREIPKVEVAGTLEFEKLTGVEPAPILEVLTSLGYSGRVIPTGKEIIHALKNLYAKSETPSSDSDDSDSDDGLLAFGAGVLLGTLLD